MRVAIVGSGVAGLVAAHLLRDVHDVQLFEADDRFGGHVNTTTVAFGDRTIPVDTGFIVHNEKTYPLFIRLLAELGVETEASDMSFSVHDARSGLEWGSGGLASVFAQRRNLVRPRFLRMVRDVLRFNREAPALLEGEDKVALGDFLCGAGYSQDFCDLYVVPMGAAIWSADPETFLRFPAKSFVRFFENHGLLDTSPDVEWRVLRGGSRSYVDAILRGLEGRAHRGMPVRALRRSEDGPTLVFDEGRSERFDRVVLALHSDQALGLLETPTHAERRVLSAIRYQENEAVLHTDPSFMPDRAAAWASWNVRIPRERQRRVFVTYHMNRLQNFESEQPVFVSLNPAEAVAPLHELDRVTYHHPVFDADAMAAQAEHGAIDGTGGVHYCGAYWFYGFHEDGVRSANRIAGTLGGRTL